MYCCTMLLRQPCGRPYGYGVSVYDTYHTYHRITEAGQGRMEQLGNRPTLLSTDTPKHRERHSRNSGTQQRGVAKSSGVRGLWEGCRGQGARTYGWADTTLARLAAANAAEDADADGQSKHRQHEAIARHSQLN